MIDYSVTVMVQFPAMPDPTRVQVSLRQLFFLDRYSDRRIRADGSVVYYPTAELSLTPTVVQ